MASEKRKAVTDERPHKKAKSVKPENETKPGAKPTRPTKSRDGESGERTPAVKSVLQQEERSFPRGGGSALTPIEKKQAEAQAERDFFAEQQTGEKAPGPHDEEDGDLFEDQEAKPAKKRKVRKDGDPGKKEGSGIKIHGLNYKNLVTGGMVLGRVTAITGKDVAVALPNNLTGYVPITSVSDKLNKRIESLLEDDAAKADDDEDEDVDLKKLFYIGQWLRVTVTATGSDTTENKSKRHIELSADPATVNANLEAENVVTNSMLQASVRSVEDHGIIMDLGLAEADVKGFVSKKELGAGYKLDDVQEGQVMLCLVTGKGSDGKVLKLSPDAGRFSALVGGKQAPVVSDAPTVDAFLPGTAVDILVTDTGNGGLVGKIMGMINVTADLLHSGADTGADIVAKYKISSKTKARIIWTLPGNDSGRRVGVSLLEANLVLPPPSDRLPENANPKLKTLSTHLSQRLPMSSFVEEAKVAHVLPDRGVYLQLPVDAGKAETTAMGFAHISQLSDSRTESISSTTGPFRVESTHKVRVLGYNPVDNLYYVSLKKSTLEQPFLRLEDLAVGEVVKGTVDRLILGTAKGITGVLVKLSESVSGLVPEMHMADIQLQHPERKFREGFPVTARVLSVDLEKRHVRLTLKKTLVQDSDLPIWSDYGVLAPDMESKGSIVNLLSTGAVVQFFGSIRAWLPVAEMSEAFVEKPDRHFRLGQTVTARILSVDPEVQEMKVSCKTGGPMDTEQQDAWDHVHGGQIVSATVTEKTADSVSLDLDNGLKGTIRTAHLVDGSAAKAEAALKRIRVGQKLSDLLVLSKLSRSRQVLLTNKASMVEDAKAKTLVRSFADVRQGNKVHGFVRNVTPEGIYVEFASGTVGLVLKSQIAPDMVGQAAFGLRKDQSVAPWILNVDAPRERFLLSLRDRKDVKPAPEAAAKQPVITAQELVNPVDPTISSSADFQLNKVTKTRIASVKGTQINVRLADNAHGRIDASEAFDTWEAIKNKKTPLQQFQTDDVLEVKILGLHDSRNHRFLPITHRQSKNPVYELSAKKSRVGKGDASLLSGMEDLKVGEEHLAFVNNHGDDCVWVSLSPSVRGRISLMDLSDDAGLLGDVGKNFPVGSALRVRIKNVMPLSNRLDLTARLGSAGDALSLDTLTPGSVVAGRVTKLSERSVTVQLADSVAGPVPLTEISDDFDQVNLTQYSKNDIVRVCVLDVDKSNKRLYLSLRPSKVLSSSLPVKDPQIPSIGHLKPGQLVRGFVKLVGDKGVVVSLGAAVDAFVRIADLSDDYIKDWKIHLSIDSLVRGRIIAVDPASKHIQLSLKASTTDPNYKAPLKIENLKRGAIVTGKVRKVEDFGAFIDIDGTMPRLSGLAHRSQVASKPVEDVRKVYEAGDVVKAKVLKVSVKDRKISLGLKASYFKNQVGDVQEDIDMDESEEDEAEAGGVEIGAEDDSDAEMEDAVDLDNVEDLSSDAGVTLEAAESSDDEIDTAAPAKPTKGLSTPAFDWTGSNALPNSTDAPSDSEPDTTNLKKRKRKPVITTDHTASLDAHAPSSTSDFERNLLSQPHDSALWIQYMAFQLRLGEPDAARAIAERALRTIPLRDLDEKSNIWTALLNLEVEYGDPERVDEVFKRACAVQEPLAMHEKLASILIDSGRLGEADAVFEKIVANKAFRASPEVWLNYATFLMTSRQEPERARALLARGLKSVPTSEHRLLTAKFAGLEFRSRGGDAERGRTIFETLVGEWPRWTQGWDMWVDLEKGRVGSGGERGEAVERVRGLFERMSKVGMGKRRARFVFKRWLEFEEGEGGGKGVERVKGLAAEWVERAGKRGEGEEE